MTAAHLGFGASGPFGRRWFSPATARALIDRALDGGIRHFDTAPFYGDAEVRLGRFLDKPTAMEIFVSTKTGTQRDSLGRIAKRFSFEDIERDVAASLRRLRRDRLDLVLLHGPSPAQTAQGLDALARLKARGDVAAIGVCGHGPEIDAALLDARVDAVMGEYNVFNQSNAARFRTARDRGVAVYGIAPLARAFYTEDFHRVRSPADVWRRARSFRDPALRAATGAARRADARARLCAHGEDPARVALGFALGAPFLDVVLTTTANPAHLTSSIEAARTPIAADAVAALRDENGV